MSYWWCLKHQRVEGDRGCAHATRLGPYETQEQAAAALEAAHKRTSDWDQDDADYRGGPSGA